MSKNSQLRSSLETLGIDFKTDFEIGKRCHMKVGGVAEIVVFPSSQKQVSECFFALDKLGLSHLVIGNFSNSLFRDGKIVTPLISLQKMRNIVIEPSGKVECDAGVLMPVIARKLAKSGLGGLSGLYGVPGSVGGGIVMNASCYGSEITEYLEAVDCVLPNGNLVSLSKAELSFDWRTSDFQTHLKDHCILRANFKFPVSDPATELNRIDAVEADRKETQETEHPNLGSFFATKNIYSDIAQGHSVYFVLYFLCRILIRLIPNRKAEFYAKLMRRMTMWFFGLRETQHIGFSKKTLNCIVNKREATATQSIEFMELVQSKVGNFAKTENLIFKDIE